MFALARRIPFSGGTVAGRLGCRVSHGETARDVDVTVVSGCVVADGGPLAPDN